MTRPDPKRNRRRTIVFPGAALALALAAAAGGADSAGPAPLTIMPLPGRAWAAIAPEGNAGIVEGASGVLLVDPPASAASARLLLARIRSLTGRSPRWTLHTRGGEASSAADHVFRKAGASRVSSSPVDLGGTSAQVSTVAVHAAGDGIVCLTREDVVFAGDLFAKETIPDLTAADTDRWVQVLDGFLGQHPASVFVGSRGQPGRALDVRYLRDYISGLRLAIGQAIERGESGAGLADRLIAIQRARFGHWTGFDARGRRNVEEVERALRAPKPAR